MTQEHPDPGCPWVHRVRCRPTAQLDPCTRTAHHQLNLLLPVAALTIKACTMRYVGWPHSTGPLSLAPSCLDRHLRAHQITTAQNKRGRDALGPWRSARARHADWSKGTWSTCSKQLVRTIGIARCLHSKRAGAEPVKALSTNGQGFRDQQGQLVRAVIDLRPAPLCRCPS